MGVAITNAVLALTDLVYLQVTALAFENIGYKYFLVGSAPYGIAGHPTDMSQVFISVCVVGFVTLWFILPETKGIPLEQMGKLFGDEDETNIYLQENPLGDTSSGEGEKKHKSDNESPEIQREPNDVEKVGDAIHVEK